MFITEYTKAAMRARKWKRDASGVIHENGRRDESRSAIEDSEPPRLIVQARSASVRRPHPSDSVAPSDTKITRTVTKVGIGLQDISRNVLVYKLVSVSPECHRLGLSFIVRFDVLRTPSVRTRHTDKDLQASPLPRNKPPSFRSVTEIHRSGFFHFAGAFPASGHRV